MLFVGNAIAPGGYGWLFPWSHNRFRVGVGVVSKNLAIDLNEYLLRFIEYLQSINKLAKFTIKEKHFGVFPGAGPIKETVANGFYQLAMLQAWDLLFLEKASDMQ